MKKRWFQTIVGFVLAALSGLAFAGGAVNVSTSGIAVDGYDPVAYFVHQKPTKGTAEFTLAYEGAQYQFSSLEHMQIFAADPARYVPQFGGYCAYGVAKGFKPAADPTVFSVVDGKLFLNKSAGIQSQWKSNIARHIKDAQDNWKTIGKS